MTKLLPTTEVKPRSMDYGIVIRPDVYADGTVAYIAEIPELPGCKSHGETPDEARLNLVDAQCEYLKALADRGLEVPRHPEGLPSVGVIWTVSIPSPFVANSGRQAPSRIPTPQTR